jgi:hypothetical protein
LLAIALLGAEDWSRPSNRDEGYPSRPLQPEVEAEPVLLPPPPIDDEYFPCSDCHEDELADPERRELDEHDDIELAHGDLWCLDCHQSDQRDLLHLSDASPVHMDESWRLCTRCHAKRIPDSCVVCHDPHSPLFKPMEPKPPPIPVGQIRPSKRAELEEVEHVER